MVMLPIKQNKCEHSLPYAAWKTNGAKRSYTNGFRCTGSLQPTNAPQMIIWDLDIPNTTIGHPFVILNALILHVSKNTCPTHPQFSTTAKQGDTYGMQRSRAWCGTPPILGVVNMVGTRNFTCYMGAL